MSAPPPPPPPIPSRSAVVPPAWDRRTARDQRRSAKLLARQQRTLQRAQLRAARRSSMLGPLLLVSLGVLFLLLETGTLAWGPTVFWFGRWWPVVLVGAGIILLAEWAIDTLFTGQRGTPLPRRTVGSGGVLLLVLLAVTGASALAVHNHSDSMLRDLDPDLLDSWGLDQVFAQHAATQQDLSAPLRAGETLNIQNYRGNVTVTGVSQDGQVHVSVRQRLMAWQRSDLRTRRQRDQPILKRDGTGLLLRVAGEGRDRADLMIEVPHESGISIAREKGEVSVSELRGPLTVEDHVGNIALTGLTGHVHLTVHDDSATVNGHSLSGDLSVEGRSGDLAFSDVTGPVVLHGDFFGTTHLERIHGPVHFQSSFTDFACADIPGELNVEGRSELEGRDLAGPVVVSTTDRNLTLTGIRNGATITDRNGSVTLSLADPLGPVKVSTTDGTVDVALPEKAAFAIAAETADGQISNTLGLTSRQQQNRTSLSGQVRKGGPSISLITSEGDIKLHTGQTSDAAAEQATDDDDTPDEPADRKLRGTSGSDQPVRRANAAR